jgi:hypothetical protein
MSETSETGIHVDSKFEVNTIIWLRSLPDDELGPSRRMVEDIEALAKRGGPYRFEEVVVGSPAEMVAALAALAVRCREGLRPILHFDCHGSDELGLLLAPSGDYLGWSDFAGALREVNVAAKNNVCCIFGVCFGMYLSLELSLSEPTPYFLTIAPEREIEVGKLEALFPPFYERLFETGNITTAYKDCLASALSDFQCQEVFAKALATYVIDHASGAAMAARRERLTTRILAHRGITEPSPEQLRDARAYTKDGLKPGQVLIDHFASTYLIGRKPGFGYAEVEKLAEGMRRRRDADARAAQRLGR